MDAVFVIGCARSATTAWAKILATAGIDMNIEIEPRLRIASRLCLEGKLEDPSKILEQAKHSNIEDARASGMIWGDKNPCYMPFIPYITRIWDAKILFLVRDGRDVVSSLMDWHEFHSGNIYALCEDGVAQERPSSINGILWDFSRPRPLPGTVEYSIWPGMTRFQKCSWYWSHFNKCALSGLEQLPSECWFQLDTTSATVSDVEEVFDFLGLSGFNADAVARILSERVNSIRDRFGLSNKFPRKKAWTDELYLDFDRFAASMMLRLGYYRRSDLFRD